jgi:ketosteroid isomerase-like protein
MNEKYSETEAANLKTVKDGFPAWKNGTGSPYQLLDENASWTIVGNSLASKEYKGRKAFIEEVITPFNARMAKPLVPTIRDIYADGDTVIVFFDAEGIAKDGKTYANTYSWFLRPRDGKIDRAVAFFDSIPFNDFWTRIPVTN